MQVTSSRFTEYAEGETAPNVGKFKASFDKTLDPSITFFTLNQSVLNGPDVLRYTGDNPITEWDKFNYLDYTDRLISMEWQQEFSFLSSITAAMADIKLVNTDDYFTRGSGSPLDANLLPRRPIRLLAGFGSETIPQFVGLTEKIPQVDRRADTASLHAQDFLSYMFTKKLDRTVMYLDMRIDQILEELFGIFGVLPDQMQLDEALTTVPFAFFEKDQSFGNVAAELMKAEMGSLYMNEAGIIVFKNRTRQTGDSVMTFNEYNVIDYTNSDEQAIINKVTVKAEVREVQPREVIFDLSEAIEIAAGDTVSKFFSLQDPATTADDIEFYTANTQADGQGTDVTSDLTVVDQTLFSDAILVEMENTGASTLFVTDMLVYGTPAKVVRNVDVTEFNQDSIDEFEEQTYTVESRYIQNYNTAQSIALSILRRFKDYGNTITMQVKSNPALQIGDKITVQLDGINDEFIIRKLQQQLEGGLLRQTVTAQKYDIPSFFTLNVSVLNGPDVLAA